MVHDYVKEEPLEGYIEIRGVTNGDKFSFGSLYKINPDFSNLN